ncbi:MAG: hypothetical protein ABII88_03035 [Candidatus Omnitrophota bacterium]
MIITINVARMFYGQKCLPQEKEVNMWTFRFMLRPVTHCKEGCSTLSWA